jgi:hypothetical protein
MKKPLLNRVACWYEPLAHAYDGALPVLLQRVHLNHRGILSGNCPRFSA